MTNILLDRLDKRLKVFSHGLLAGFTVSKQFFHLLRHTLARAFTFIADTRHGLLQMRQHLAHARLHGVLGQMHVRQQLRNHRRAGLIRRITGRTHVLDKRREALLHGLHGGHRLPHQVVQAIKLLAKGAFQLVHKSDQHIFENAFHLPGLGTAGGLNGSCDSF